MQKPRRSGTPCRLEHHGLTSHEVSMQKPKRSGTPCRLEHHGPTSSEVSMRNRYEETREPPVLLVGFNISDPPLTRWVCAADLTRTAQKRSP